MYVNTVTIHHVFVVREGPLCSVCAEGTDPVGLRPGRGVWLNTVKNEEDVKSGSSPCSLGRKLLWDTRLDWSSVAIRRRIRAYMSGGVREGGRGLALAGT